MGAVRDGAERSGAIMPIPDYQSLMLPVLQACADGQEHRVAELADRMADRFDLSPEERARLRPSGGQPVIVNRSHWAIFYMVKAGLLERPRRASVRITDRGRTVLAQDPTRIDNAFLCQFEEFREFRAGSGRTDRPPQLQESEPAAETPEERILAARAEIEAELKEQLLRRVREGSPRFFEMLVVQLLVAMGYGNTLGGIAAAVGGSGDGGIDGLVDQDPLGLDRVYLQAKRYAADNPVGPAKILEFAGALSQRHATKGVFITTSSFTEAALETVQRLPHRIVLIDGDRLAQLMIRHDVGVRIAETLHIKKIDEDFFLEA